MRSDTADERSAFAVYARAVRRAFPVVYVRDVGAALAFYVGVLGWEEQYRFPADGEPGYVGLKRDASDLGLAHESWPRDSMGLELGDGPRFELFVYVDDVDESLARALEAGAPLLSAPEDMPWESAWAAWPIRTATRSPSPRPSAEPGRAGACRRARSACKS
jgi:lactoylglutathione lyase